MFSSQFEQYTAGPPSTIHHIIWNILITDKITTITPELIQENKIKHIIAILPHKEDYDALNIPDITHDIMEYGNDHSIGYDKDLYDIYCKK